MHNTTEVFHHSILPVRNGVYLTQSVDPEDGRILSDWMYSYFDATDRVWGCAAITPAEAHSVPDYEFAWQTKNWRGLTEEAKA
jgi:hypothetical protein